MHNCLLCEYSQNFMKPISMTDGNQIHLGFTCKKGGKIGAYGFVENKSNMIIDLVTF
jgi:hypothetical protein